MKTKFFAVLFLLLSAQSFANGDIKTVEVKFNDDTVVKVNEDVKDVTFGYDNRIETIELNSGHIYYGSEVDEFKLKSKGDYVISFPDSDLTSLKQQIERVIGGDGSGGG